MLIRNISKLPAWMQSALLLLWWLATAAWRPLSVPDEGRYGGIAYHMLVSGDWLVPRIDSLPFFHKPPLLYWLDAAAMAVFGVNEWAVRLPSALAAWLACMVVYLAVKSWHGVQAARWTVAVLATMPLFYAGGQYANMDMLVGVLTTLCILGLAQAVRSVELGRRDRRALAFAYAMAALAVLAKGLIGFVIPGSVIGLWLLSERRWKTLWSLFWLPGILLFFLIASPWFILVNRQFPQFLDYFFVEQHFRRYVGADFNNVFPVWFYPGVLIVGLLPWTPFLVPALRQAWKTPSAQLNWSRLYLVWTLFVLVFFSIPRSKLIGYIFPAVPPLAVLVGCWLAERSPVSPRLQRIAVRVCVGAALFCIVIVGTVAHFDHKGLKPLAQQVLPELKPEDRIVYVGTYFFDLDVYLQRKTPSQVVSIWDAAEVQKRDNWRKELWDGGRFEAGQGRALLISPEQLAGAFCAPGVTWFFVSDGDKALHPVFSRWHPVFRQRDINAYRSVVDGKGPGSTEQECAGRHS